MTDFPTNPAAAQTDKLIKTLEAILTPIAQNAIVAAVPALGLPVVHQIIDSIEQALSDKLTKLAEQGITFKIIDYQTDNEDSDVNDARAALSAALKSGDKNAISKALADFQKAQSAIINCDGSAVPQ